MDKNLINLTPQAFAQLPLENGGERLVNPSAFFGELRFKHKKLAEEGANGYKIYKNAKEFVSVEAESAAKALEACGVKNPYKIIRTRAEMKSIVGKGLLVDG